MSDLAVEGAATTPERSRPQPSVRRGLAALLLVGFLVLAVAVPVTVSVLLGERPFDQIHLGYPGVDVAVVTSVLNVVGQASSMIAIGALVHILFLRDAAARSAWSIPEGFEIKVLRVSSAVWAVCAAGMVVFESLDASGSPLARLMIPGAFEFLYQTSDAPRAWTISLGAAMIVFFGAYFADRWTAMLIPLWAAIVAVLAPVVTGQVLVGPDHDFGGDAAVFQTLAVNVFFGSVVVAALRVASGRRIAPVTLRRLFAVAVVALPVLLVSDLIIALFKLSGGVVTASLTGWLIIAGATCLIVVVAAVLWAWSLMRRSLLRAHHITVLMTVMALAVAGWLGVAVAMTRQPPPQYFAPSSITKVFMGFDVPDAPTPVVLFTQWRPNLLFLGLAATAVTVYLLAVRALRRRGDSWPVGRTIAWISGWAVVVFATSSGFGKYSAPDFGVHMIVHMSLNMLAPALLVLGGVVTLLLRATRSVRGAPAGWHDWLTWVLNWPVLKFLYNPLLVFVLFVGSYYGLYFTGIFDTLMRFHWAHQMMNVHFLVIGYLYYSLVIGVDRPPRPLPHIGKLGYVLAAMPFHAFFGVILMTGNFIIAEDFYLNLALPWADLPAQQYFAGGVAWAGGEIPLMIVITILAIQWGRQDAREARRKDRHLDTGRDDEFDVYNRMLQRLSDRDTATARPEQPRPEDPAP